MFKMTKGDLAKKTDAQLAALFQEVTKKLVPPQTDIASALLLRAMISAEIAKRAPSP